MYQLPTPYGFRDIARTRFSNSRSLQQGQIKVTLWRCTPTPPNQCPYHVSTSYTLRFPRYRQDKLLSAARPSGHHGWTQYEVWSQNMNCITSKIPSLLPLVRPLLNTFQKDPFITSGVIANTNKCIDRQTEKLSQKHNLLLMIITVFLSFSCQCFHSWLLLSGW